MFGAIRAPYSAPCRFFADEAPGSNRIIWIPAKQGAIWYTEPTIFVPRIEFSDQPPPQVYEKTGWIKRQRKYWRVVDRYQYTGDHFHGDNDDFRGKSLKAKYIVDGQVEIACPPERIFLFEDIHLKQDEFIETYALANGVHLSIDNALQPEAALPSAYALPTRDTYDLTKLPAAYALALPSYADKVRLPAAHAIALRDPIADLLLLPAAIAVRSADALSPDNLVGLPFCAALALTDELPLPFSLPLAQALSVTDLPPATETLTLPTAIVWRSSDRTPATATLSLPFASSARVQDVSPPPALLKLPYALAGEVIADVDLVELPAAAAIVVSDEAGPPTPGSDCDGAATISLGVDYTYDIASGAQHWFKFPVTGGTQYHVKLTINSGDVPSAQVYSGSSCGSKSSEFLLFAFVPCNTFTPGSDKTCYVQVLAGFFSGGNYTLNAGTGACP